jgi:hypothetical protein
MKKRKKKYNPLKKYSQGGKHDEQPDTQPKPNPQSPKWDDMSQGTFNALMAGYESGEGDDKPEDLMKGRTFIPRMSESQREAIIAGGKKLVDKMRAKREEKKEKKLADTRKEKYEATDSEIYDDSPVDSDEMLSMPEEEYAKYGAKILKKYANGGEFDKFKMKKTVRKKNQEGVTSDAPISEAAQSEIDSQRVAGKKGRYTKTKKKRKDIPPTSMKKTVTERFPTSKKKTITKRSNR